MNTTVTVDLNPWVVVLAFIFTGWLVWRATSNQEDE